MRKAIICHTLGTEFRKCTKIVSEPLQSAEGQNVLVRICYVGINASDVNYTAGKYLPGKKPPLPCGFEGIGTVVAIGSEVKKIAVGQAVALTVFGCFSDFIIVPEWQCLKISSCSPQVLPLLVSGLTASLALDEVGELQKGETVFVTAAAGGTGLFAIQLAKLAGCTTIGTCSSDEKCKVLKELGCDRPINYKKENLREVLKNEFPKGINVVYESVGGEFFDISVDALAVRGRLIVIGFISGYMDGSGWVEEKSKKVTPLPAKLLGKSASVRGFYLNAYIKEWPRSLEKLSDLVSKNKLKSVLDSASFTGLEQVADAVEYLHSGKNTGKVYVTIQTPDASL